MFLPCGVMPSTVQTKLRSVLKRIHTGDLLLWTPTSPEGRAIAVASRSPYAHSGMAAWLQVGFSKWRLCSLDMMSGLGGVVFPLAFWVSKHPGVISVFSADPENRYKDKWNPRGAADYWLDNFWGMPYGDRSVRRTALAGIPVLRWLFRPVWKDNDVSVDYPFCSESLATSTQRGGNVDTVLQLAPRSTWPGDLGRATFYGMLAESLVL